MKPPRRKTILTLSALLLMVGISLVFLRAVKKDSDLPVYAGKNLEEWFYGEDGHPGRKPTLEAAEKAFDKLGTNSIPFLIGKLRMEDTLIRKGYCTLFPILPITIQEKLPPAIDASYVQEIARHHLEAIPIQRLTPFAHEISNLYAQLRRRSYRNGITFLQRKPTFHTDELMDNIPHILTAIQDGLPIEQLDAAILLSKVDESITNGIPILLNAVTNWSGLASLLAQNATSSSTSDDYMASQHLKEAHEALSRIDPELAKQYPLKPLPPQLP